MPNELNTLEAVNGSLQITSLATAKQFAEMVIKSGLAPSSFRTAESVMVACQLGAELHLKPMQSLQSICVINGKPSVYGKALAGIVLASGLCENLKEWTTGTGDNMAAFCMAKRKGIAEPRTAEFTVAMAKTAGVWKKAGPWSSYPDVMMSHKARARCLGVLFADVLVGLPVYEDLIGLPESRKEPRDVAPVDPLLHGTVIKSVESSEPAIPADGGIRMSIEQHLGDPDLDVPPDLLEGDVNEPSAYVGFAKRIEKCTTATELNKIAAEASNSKDKLTTDQKAELQNLYKDRVKDFKK